MDACPASTSVRAASSVLVIVVSAARIEAYRLAVAASSAIFLTSDCSTTCVARRSLMEFRMVVYSASVAASRRRPAGAPESG